MPQYACLYGTGFLTVGQLTVDADPLPKDTMDDLNISHVKYNPSLIDDSLYPYPLKPLKTLKTPPP